MGIYQVGVPQGCIYQGGVPQGVYTREGVPQGVYASHGVPQGVYTSHGVPQGVHIPQGGVYPGVYTYLRVVYPGVYHRRDIPVSLLGRAAPSLVIPVSLLGNTRRPCATVLSVPGLMPLYTRFTGGFIPVSLLEKSSPSFFPVSLLGRKAVPGALSLINLNILDSQDVRTHLRINIPRM